MKLPVGTQFTPVADFFSPSLKSAYCKGLSYRVREGDDKLAELAGGWLAEGKIVLGAGDAGLGHMTGSDQ